MPRPYGLLSASARFLRNSTPHPTALLSTLEPMEFAMSGVRRSLRLGASALLAASPLFAATSAASPATDALLALETPRAVDELVARQEAARQDTPAEIDPRAAKEKRVLRLAGGGTLRALCHLEGSTWRVRQGGAWVSLDEAAVTGWRGEAELLREARRLGRELGAKDHGQRIVFAEWQVSQGLVDEARDELDRVLQAEPDFPAALTLLADGPFPRPRAGNPEAEPEAVARRLCAAGVSAGPVQRELLIQSLGALQETERGTEVLRKTLIAELHSPRVLRRTFAAHALRRRMPGEELFPLLQRCVLDVSPPVRREAALGVRAAGDDGVVLPLVKALGSESRAIRTNAAESLGHVGIAAAVPSLVGHFANLPQGSGGGTKPVTAHIYIGNQFAYVQDFDLEIAQGASIADPIVQIGQEAKILDARVGGISGYTYVREYRSVRESLKRLTGANPGSSPRDWQRWYDEHRARFETEREAAVGSR